MAISGFVSIPECGRDSEREGGGAHPARLRPQDAEEVVGKRRYHIRSALSGTENHPIVPAWKAAVTNRYTKCSFCSQIVLIKFVSNFYSTTVTVIVTVANASIILT